LINNLSETKSVLQEDNGYFSNMTSQHSV